jgi:hypothetical protein
MRTAAAYISKLKAENLGRTFKVQDTNHRLFTSTLYRGAAGCGPVDFTQIDYIEPCLCDYIGLAKRAPNPPVSPVTITYDGGNPTSGGTMEKNGGSVRGSGNSILNGGNP